MRNCIILLCLSLIAIHFQARAQLADGAYISQAGRAKNLILIKDHYLSFIDYDDSDRHFGYTWGGPIQQQGDNVTIIIEYDTKDSSHIGKTANLYFKIQNGSIPKPSHRGPTENTRSWSLPNI